jgi:hypothetical protein
VSRKIWQPWTDKQQAASNNRDVGFFMRSCNQRFPGKKEKFWAFIFVNVSWDAFPMLYKRKRTSCFLIVTRDGDRTRDLLSFPLFSNHSTVEPQRLSKCTQARTETLSNGTKLSKNNKKFEKL